MKQCILLVALLITACAPQVVIEVGQPVEEIPTEEPQIIEQPSDVIGVITEEPKEISTQQNMIEIRKDAFYPKEKAIGKNTEIQWVNRDESVHKIACYLGGTRVTTSSNLAKGDFFTYTFLEGGVYTCIDAIYGLRSTVTVKHTQELFSPTGRVVAVESADMIGDPLAAIAVLAFIILLFFIYGRKRR